MHSPFAQDFTCFNSINNIDNNNNSIDNKDDMEGFFSLPSSESQLSLADTFLSQGILWFSNSLKTIIIVKGQTFVIDID